MAKNAKNAKNVEAGIVECHGINFPTSISRPVVTLVANVVAAIFGLYTNSKGSLCFYSGEGEPHDNPDDDSLTVCDSSNFSSWVAGGLNAGNRPFGDANSKKLLSAMLTGKYYFDVALQLIFSESQSPGHEGEITIANGQHTLAAWVCYYNSVDEQGNSLWIDGEFLQMVLVDYLDPAAVDLIDAPKLRTITDSLARRGYGKFTDGDKTYDKGRVYAQVIRLAVGRYENAQYPYAVKSAVSIQTALEKIESGGRYAAIPNVLREVTIRDHVIGEDGKKGKAGLLTARPAKYDPKTDRGIGIPAHWLVFAGMCLVNGKKTKPAEFADWIQKVTVKEHPPTSPCGQLAKYLRAKMPEKINGSVGHWKSVKAVLLAFDADHAKVKGTFDLTAALAATERVVGDTENGIEPRLESHCQQGNADKIPDTNG